MKILATIPGKYSRPAYIIEAHTDEVASLTMLSSVYGHVVVTNAAGDQVSRKVEELAAGDVIDPAVSEQRRNALAEYVNARDEIKKATAVMRGALTKLEGITTPIAIP